MKRVLQTILVGKLVNKVVVLREEDEEELERREEKLERREEKLERREEKPRKNVDAAVDNLFIIYNIF